jgi:glycosyltransferase involved in cell wall biosynthesis
MLLHELPQRHEVTVLALAWDATDHAALSELHARGVNVHIVRHGAPARVRGLIGDPRRPLQQMVSSSTTFAQTARGLLAHAARQRRPFDVVHVEHLRGAAALDVVTGLGTRVVFDAVDCIAELAHISRTQGPTRAVRWLGALEEQRTARYEARLVQAADAVTVVAERDRAALAKHPGGERVVVAPNGVAALPQPAPTIAAPIAIFTGKLSYHANLAAARWLLDDIWPRVRQELPDARLFVAGAEAPAWLRQRAGTMGVHLIENPPEMLPVIAGARVALAPMVYSVGIQNKMLEAMACGVPVVATASAAAGLPAAAAASFVTAYTPESFAAKVAELLTDRVVARTLGQAGFDYVSAHHTWAALARRFEALYAPTARTELAA